MKTIKVQPVNLYQSRTTRVWNTLPRDLTTDGTLIDFKMFRKTLFNYYKTALENCYDADDP